MRGTAISTLNCDCQSYKNCERHDLRLHRHIDIQDNDGTVSTFKRLGADRWT